MRGSPVPDRGYLEFGRWFGAIFGLNFGFILGNVIHNTRHWMYGPEVIVMLRGAQTVQVDGVEYRLEAGDVLTIDSFQAHEIYDGTPGGLQMILNFEESLLRRTGDVRLALSTVGEHALPRDHPDICDFRENLCELAQLVMQQNQNDRITAEVSDESWAAVRAYFYRLMMLLSRHQIHMEHSLPESPMLLADCVQMIHQRYREPLTIGDLAASFNYSESSLYRLFRRSLGISFLEYLTSVRLNVACGMLMKREKSVMEIADLCGFSSYGNFYRVFRERMGTSPVKYREESVQAQTQWWTPSDMNPLYHYNQFQMFPVCETDNWNTVKELVRTCCTCQNPKAR